MGEMRRIEVLVDEQVANDMNAALRDGDYPDEAALLQEALTIWRSFRDAEDVGELRATIAEVIERDEWLEGNFALSEVRSRHIAD